MTATESSTAVLRRMLDECGVEWGNVRNDGSESDYLTEWQFDGIEGRAIATEWSVGQHLTVCITHSMTPEQAIAATLGAGTCRNVKAEYISLFGCSECGYENWDVFMGDTSEFRFCPNCGKRVIHE